jgi:peptidoglycan LD-endopeptidase LytH
MKRIGWALVTVALVSTAAWWIAGDRLRTLWPLVVESPHEQFARSLADAHLDETTMGRAWLGAAAAALDRPAPLQLPAELRGRFDPASPSALGWRFRAARGRRIEVDVEIEGTARVFVDLFEERGERRVRAASADAGASLRFEPTENGMFVLRVQPELLGGGEYRIAPRAVATLRFPVEGVTARSVASVFGDPRDRGTRSHEGVDIFARRGAPAVAATDGWVTRVATTRLGGKVVWVWDPARGQALYYAHLDRQDVTPGTRVHAGDPLGVVGNTGNARTTAPHLHFGIYRPLHGAVDPLPFICDAPCGARGMAYAP